MVGSANPPSKRSTSVQFAGWPIPDPDEEDLVAEESELLIMNILSDIQNILRVTKIIPNRIYIYVSAQWKQRLYQKILKIILIESKANFGEIMKALSNDEQVSSGVKKNVSLIRKMIEDILSLPVDVRQRQDKIGVTFDESYPIRDASKLLSIESTNRIVDIQVYREEEEQIESKKVEEERRYINNGGDRRQTIYDPKSKAKHSRPFKPAVYIE
jgi:leucyl-tRNA synthetase